MKNPFKETGIPSCGVCVSAIIGILGLASVQSPANTVTWTGTSGATWSGSANWTPNIVGGPGSGDTAVIGDTTASRYIIYDAAAPSTLGTLSITHTGTSAGFVDALQFIKTATSITNSFSIGNGTGTGTVQLLLDPSLNQVITQGAASKTGLAAGSAVSLTIGGGSGTLTLNSGGQLTLNTYAYQGTYGGTTGYATVSSTLSGNVVISGGLVYASGASTNNSTTSGIGAVFPVINGSVTMTSGTLSTANGDTNNGSRLQINGDLNVSGGAIAAGAGTKNGGLYLNGTNNTISGSATLSTSINLYLLSSGSQNLSSSVSLGGIFVQPSATGTTVKTVAVTSAGNNVGAITFRNLSTTSGQTTLLRLGSNLSTSAALTEGAKASSGGQIYGVDLNGYGLSIASSTTWTPVATYSSTWGIINTSSTTGTISAGAFDFSSAYAVNIGTATANGSGTSAGQVILQATGTAANNLGGTGTITANSTFLYTGTSATLTSNRTIGNLSVGSGTSASALKIVGTNLNAAGTVNIADKGTLDLNNFNLSGAGLSGGTSATLTNNGSGLSTVTVNGGGTYAGVIANGSGTTALTLTTGNLVLAGTNTYTGATTVTGGTLTVNGSLAAGSSVSVSGAVLSGSGSANGTITGTNATINGSNLNLGATTLRGSSRLTGINNASSVTVVDGTTALSGTTASTGTVMVSVGATLNNSGTVSGNMSVDGVLKGNGTLIGNLTLSGTLAPGNSAGLTTINGNLLMNSSATLAMEVTGATAGVTYDQIKVSGNVTLAGTLDLTTLSGLTMGETITLIENTGSGTTSGYFSTIITSGSTYSVTSSGKYNLYVGSTEYEINYAANTDSGSVYNDVTLTVVPEPSTWAMLIGGIGMLGLVRQMRGKFQAK